MNGEEGGLAVGTPAPPHRLPHFCPVLGEEGSPGSF